MHRKHVVIAFAFFVISIVTVPLLMAQDQPVPQYPDSTAAPSDTVQKSDIQPSSESPPPPKPQVPQVNVLDEANMWIRHLLYRGTLNATHIGAYAQYQLTSWREGIGSYGPVEARVTVYYLGSSEWLGKEGEWLQAVYRTMESEPTVIEYDLIVPSASKITEVYRVLYRVDQGDIRSGSFDIPENQVDYDVIDRPVPVGAEEISLYSGTYLCETSRGSGFDGAEVVLYSSAKIPPLGIVRIGYGDEGLTFTGGGTDAAPHFNVPPPPGR